MAPSATPTRYRDRSSGAVVTERVFGGSGLNLLYEHRPVRWLTDTLLTHPWLNQAYGLWQRAPWTRRSVRTFVETHGIDASEADQPIDAYPSLDAFFTRRLRADCRPVHPDPRCLVSPCDGRVLVYPRLDGARLRVKRCDVTLARLVGDATLAARYAGGAALVLRLAPADYHWFHFPTSGEAGPTTVLPGRLHSVHPIALGAGAPSFYNARHVSMLSTETFGELLLIEVGAMLVGTILQRYTPGPVVRGAVKGLFRFGGSTVVLVAPAERLRFDDDLVATTAEGLETLVRMGTRIAEATQ